MTTDNTQVGLKKLCEAFIDGDISAGQFKRAVRIWHNKQVEAVLDEANQKILAETAIMSSELVVAVGDVRSAIERVRKEMSNGE